MAKKFTAPAKEYAQTQPAAPEQPTVEVLPPYRFNVKMPGEYGKYLQERAWRTSLEEHSKCSITDYLNRLIKADMDAHPEWTETIDILNK